MKATISKTFEFAAAHRLTGVPDAHPCHRFHGHTWKVVIEVRGEVNNTTGFVMDFRDLSAAVKPILDSFDHYTLNDFLANPTSEHLAQYILENLIDKVPALNAVEVYESERSRCRVERHS